MKEGTEVKEREGQTYTIKAQTCFNRIVLPEFKSEEEMKKGIESILQSKEHWLYFDLE